MAKIDFRDGTREIPDWQAEIMAGVDTVSMTYEQAMRAANQKMKRDHVNRAADKVISQHFRDMRGR